MSPWMQYPMRTAQGTMLAAFIVFAGTMVFGAEEKALDEELRGYRATEASGPANALNRRLESGQSTLSFDPIFGYLPALLKEFKTPVSSQLLVASKTSPNKDFISPKTPRALYFSDEVSVAYTPGAGMLEIASADPNLGVVFYTLSQTQSERPRLVRDDRCLECHASSKTLNIPGWMVRSFATQPNGEVDVLSGVLVTHRTPLAERWGGYFVTGSLGLQKHRGNLFGGELAPPRDVLTLEKFLDVKRYPEPGSDVVALMTLEHQAHAGNLLTRFHYDTRFALEHGDSLRVAFPAAEAALRYFLFADEYRLAAPVHGSSAFAREFADRGPKDSHGRSLRDFDLQTRLFKYPCSYMIYSAAFEALPSEAKKHFYHRLWEVLDGQDASGAFANLTAESRAAIREILIETKPDLPTYWRL